MNNREKLSQMLSDLGVTCMIPDGYDDAIIGIITNYVDIYDEDNNEDQGVKVAYSTDLMINILKERDGMTAEEAMEFIDYNVEGYQPQDGVYFGIVEIENYLPDTYIPFTNEEGEILHEKI